MPGARLEAFSLNRMTAATVEILSHALHQQDLLQEQIWAARTRDTKSGPSNPDSSRVTHRWLADGDSFALRTALSSDRLVAEHQDDGNDKTTA